MAPNESVISAPPPPPEVKVRTMQADLAAMAKSGGGLPRFENVKVEGWEPRSVPAARNGPGGAGMPPAAGAAGSTMAEIKRSAENRRMLNLALVILIIALSVGAIGYFVYENYFSGRAAPAPAAEQSNANPAPTAPAALPPAAPLNTSTPSAPPANGAPAAASPPAVSSSTAAPAPALSGPFTHASFFSKPVDQTLTLTLSTGGPAQTAADLLSFSQKLSSLLLQAKKGSSFIEIDVVGSDGNGVPVSDIWSQAGTTVLDPQFLAAHFDPDATFFAYRDGSGTFWPGYVLALNPGENWLFLQSGVAKLESSPALANFFLTDVGLPTGGFGDSTLSGTPIRILSYPSAQPPASFVYGWSHGANAFLILSTSENGFSAALAHL